MKLDSFSSIVLLTVYLGTAGVFGYSLRRLKEAQEAYSPLVSAVFSFLCLAAGSFILPFSISFQILLWLAALLIVLVYAMKPSNMPALFWSPRFAYRFSAIVMLLILLWGIFSKITIPTILLGGFAALAGILAWQRSLNCTA